MKRPILSLTCWRDSIQIKISVMLIVLTTLMLSGFGIYQYLALRSRKITELTTLAEVVKARLAENLTVPLWDYDNEQVNKVILSEMRERCLYAILVRGTTEVLFGGKVRDEQ